MLYKESCDMSQGNGHQMGRVDGCLREGERESTASLSQILGELWIIDTEKERGNGSHSHPLKTRPKTGDKSKLLYCNTEEQEGN